MVSAIPEPNAGRGLGVGDVNIYAARLKAPTNPPNPNAGLDQFLASAGDGTRVFDSAAWRAAALANKAWNASPNLRRLMPIIY